MQESAQALLKKIWNEKVHHDYKVSHLAYAAMGCYVAYKVIDTIRWKQKNTQVHARANAIYDERNSHFENFNIKGKDVDRILSLDLTQLREELLKGNLTSVDLVNVFGERCQRIGRALNLSAEENFKEALKLAAEKDAQLAEARRQGPEALAQLPILHGIPFSVKDQINEKGKMATIGCAFLCGKRAAEDAIVVKQFRRAGGIPLVRGSTPQMALSLHTKNLIWGEAKNPHSNDRAVGGSTGGDAGLVCARCVPLGIGTDLAGSLRLPGTFCGIPSFKPTQTRFSKKGNAFARKGGFNAFNYYVATSGSLGKTVSDLVVATTIQCDPEVHLLDPLTTPTSWNEDSFQSVQRGKGQIKVGVLQPDPFMPVTDAVKRALAMAEKGLRDCGYQVVPFELAKDDWKEQRELVSGIWSNGAIQIQSQDLASECETVLPPLRKNLFIMNAGTLTRFCIDFAFKYILNKGRLHDNLNGLRKMPPLVFEQFLKRRNQWTYDVSARWQAAGIDALLCPSYPSCGIKASSEGDLGVMVQYTTFWNVNGFPAGTLPVTAVRGNELTYKDDYNDSWTKALQEDIKDSEGMPISIQIVGYPYEDEKVLGVMKQLEQQIGFKLEMPKQVEPKAKQKMD